MYSRLASEDIAAQEHEDLEIQELVGLEPK